MFAAILSRSIPRRTFANSVRCLSQKVPGAPSQKIIKNEPAKESLGQQPETSKRSTEPASTESIPNESVDFPTTMLPTLDFSPKSEQEPQRTGARSSTGTLSSNEQKRQNMTRISLAILALGMIANAVYMGREWSEDDLRTKKRIVENAMPNRWGRTKARFMDIFNYFNEPIVEQLLPPKSNSPYQRTMPYTLLVSLDDMLITSIWDRKFGWRTAKRPGADYFLAYLSQFYELVIFTSQSQYTAQGIIEKLDPYHFYITATLTREYTRSIKGQIVKDLSYLNRDLSQVILLDTNPDHVATQPENAIIMPKWKGEPNDKGLVAMIPFLESIAIYKPPDVRPILEAYKDKDIPFEYAKKEATAKAKFLEDWEKKGHPSSGSSVRGLFGFSSASQRPSGGPPLTYLEAKRKEAQETYQKEQIYVKENKEEIEKAIALEKEAFLTAGTPGSLWEAIQGKKATEEKLDADNKTTTSSSEPSKA